MHAQAFASAVDLHLQLVHRSPAHATGGLRAHAARASMQLAIAVAEVACRPPAPARAAHVARGAQACAECAYVVERLADHHGLGERARVDLLARLERLRAVLAAADGQGAGVAGDPRGEIVSLDDERWRRGRRRGAGAC